MIKHIRIEVEGLVQGVGFRPFVCKEATRHNLSGSVVNLGGAVEIIVSGEENAILSFLKELKENPPELSKIDKLTVFDILDNAEDSISYQGFVILDSKDSEPGSFIPPDLGLCPDCEKEILDKNNIRRFRHCFTGCVKCGPRFSMLKLLPYDRKNTALSDFPLCQNCKNEYDSPSDRRHSAENNCCQDCGPLLAFYQNDGANLTGDNALNAAVKIIKNGGVIAVKGIGGYHLCCSPYIDAAVKKLRRIKFREEKPFAVMFPDINAIQKICAVSEKELDLLVSPARPIVLLSVLSPKNNLFAQSVLENNDICGCFLPYTPLHRLITEELGEIVLTSANIAGGAIILKDEDMPDFAEHSGLDGILSHNREIIRSSEDSVCQINCGEIQILRRSRGYAPGSFALPCPGSDFLALGGDLKASFAVVKNGRACMSQYFGDLEDISSQKAYADGIADFLRLYRVTPEFIICDAHPNYFSSVIAAKMGLPIKTVQHHHAHAASVLAEHAIYPENPAIAVVFDGTGYGNNGTIWGGEFFVWQERKFTHRGHLRYIDILGADSAAFDAGKTALCYLETYNINPPDILKKDVLFTETVKAALKNKINVFRYSGAGRLFDALSAIIGLSQKNQYEGACAALFEQTARLSRDLTYAADFNITCENGMYIADPFQSFHLAATLPRDKISDFAYGFHLSLARAVEKIVLSLSEETGIKTVLLSGGVFQNRLLSELTAAGLEKAGLKVFQNSACPPNDNGICLGQAYIGGLCNNPPSRFACPLF